MKRCLDKIAKPSRIYLSSKYTFLTTSYVTPIVKFTKLLQNQHNHIHKMDKAINDSLTAIFFYILFFNSCKNLLAWDSHSRSYVLKHAIITLWKSILKIQFGLTIKDWKDNDANVKREIWMT